MVALVENDRIEFGIAFCPFYVPLGFAGDARVHAVIIILQKIYVLVPECVFGAGGSEVDCVLDNPVLGIFGFVAVGYIFFLYRDAGRKAGQEFRRRGGRQVCPQDLYPGRGFAGGDICLASAYQNNSQGNNREDNDPGDNYVAIGTLHIKEIIPR